MSNEEKDVMVEEETQETSDFVINFSAVKRAVSENKTKIMFGAGLVAANLIGFAAGQMMATGKIGCPLGLLKDGEEADEWVDEWADQTEQQEDSEEAEETEA